MDCHVFDRDACRVLCVFGGGQVLGCRQRPTSAYLEVHKKSFNSIFSGFLRMYGNTFREVQCSLSERWVGNPCFFFCCSGSFVVGSLKDEPGRRVSE